MPVLPKGHRKQDMRQQAVGLSIILVAAAVVWLIHVQSIRQVELAGDMVIHEAIAHFDNMVIARRWNAKHGGVFVKQKGDMQPNPYLEDGSIRSDRQELLIKINPAWMTRQISELTNLEGNYYYRITSLKPLNPDNAPDSFETQALRYFESNPDERYFYRFDERLDFMGALPTEQACLACHADQGYVLGDVRGGIRVSLPLDLYRENVGSVHRNQWVLSAVVLLVALALMVLFRLLIRELQDTERRLMMSEKMASLSGLVAGVAHEINTPLGICIGSSSHLLDATRQIKTAYARDAVSEEDFERYLQSAEELAKLTLNNLNRAADLVTNFKQVAVDSSTEERCPVSIRDRLENTLLVLRQSVEAAGVDVVLECDPKLIVSTYPGAIARIVTSLVTNSLAHAFAPGSGGRIRLTAQLRNGFLELIYSDDGKGIAAHDLPRIYDPFFTTDRNRGGTGLGLHIVYNLVTERLQGSIACDSTPGKGVRFSIRIPITDETGR